MRALLDLVVPNRCAGCGLAGPVLCAGCGAGLGVPSPVRLPRGLPPVYALGRYRGPVRGALLEYKERGRRELAVPLGRAVADAVRELTALAAGPPPHDPPPHDPTVWLVPAPSRRSAASRRGGDHVLRLARSAAAALAGAGVPAAVAPALRLASGVRDSVGLDAAARAANLAGRVCRRAAGMPPRDTRIVLLDDVVTTGATIAACAGALSAAGLRVAAAVVLASAAPLLQPGDLRDLPVTRGCQHGVSRRMPA